MKRLTLPSTLKHIIALTATGLLSGSIAFAIPVAPAGTIGTLPANSFTGSGIPTDDVMLSTSGGLTLGLSAHTRPPAGGLIGTDNAGTFIANTGISSPGLATWNFDFYINNTGNGGLAAYTYTLSYGYASDVSALVSFNPLIIPDNGPLLSLTTAGNSENLGFAAFGTPIGFNPNATADYGFVLTAKDVTGATVAQSAIVVKVASVPDSGSTVALLSVAFAGIAGLRRKFAA